MLGSSEDEDESMEHLPIVDMDSINKVVSFSQNFHKTSSSSSSAPQSGKYFPLNWIRIFLVIEGLCE